MKDKEKEKKIKGLGVSKQAGSEAEEKAEEVIEEVEKTYKVPELKEKVLPDPAIEKMTKEEALAYFDLPEWASKKDLDDQFWKLGKTYRAKNDEQKLADIACAYSIASGERDRKQKEEKEEIESKHYFGKSTKEWQNIWHYYWWVPIIVVAAIFFISAFIKVYFIEPRVDLRVASIGHFEYDDAFLSAFFSEYTDLKNPDLQSADVVSENSEGAQTDKYAVQKATSMMAVHPDVLVFDMPSVPVYVNSGDLKIMDEEYEKMKATWSAEDLARIEPYVYSRARFYDDYVQYMSEEYQEQFDPLEPQDYEDHIYGFIIRDRVDQLSLGFDVQWKQEDSAIIVGVGAGSGDLDKAVEMCELVLSNIDTMRETYEKTYPYANTDD
ncbi:MAG: hypothetical protein J5607_03145 [Clostridiales bacterium]|nr:hypothetical protein [Clostridiales bacterium]